MLRLIRAHGAQGSRAKELLQPPIEIMGTVERYLKLRPHISGLRELCCQRVLLPAS